MIRFLRSIFTASNKHRSNPDLVAILKQVFDEDFYLKNNPDVASGGMEGLDHYLRYGFKEKRLPCDEMDIALAVSLAAKKEDCIKAVSKYKNRSFRKSVEELYRGKKLVLPFHSKGNFFFREISQHIAEAALACGVEAVLVDEKEFKALEPSKNVHCFFVAPQEFFYLGRKKRLHDHAKEFMPGVTYLLAEQPQTVFFLSQLEYIFDDVHLVDMNFHVATYLCSLDIPCHYLSLDCVESLKATDKRPFGQSAENMYIPKGALSTEANDRPVDAVFIGNGCERRQQFFNQYAEPLANFNMAVFTPDWSVPHTVGGLATLDANDSIALCQRSKIFLNIHRDNFEYFEWHRICMRGFLSGALVLTEPVFNVPGFESGVHYIECKLEEMPEKIDWLLNSAEGQETMSKIAAAGRSAYLNTSMPQSIASYLSFVENSRA